VNCVVVAVRSPSGITSTRSALVCLSTATVLTAFAALADVVPVTTVVPFVDL
jgi:hypothetical protein